MIHILQISSGNQFQDAKMLQTATMHFYLLLHPLHHRDVLSRILHGGAVRRYVLRAGLCNSGEENESVRSNQGKRIAGRQGKRNLTVILTSTSAAATPTTVTTWENGVNLPNEFSRDMSSFQMVGLPKKEAPQLYASDYWE